MAVPAKDQLPPGDVAVLANKTDNGITPPGSTIQGICLLAKVAFAKGATTIFLVNTLLHPSGLFTVYVTACVPTPATAGQNSY